MARKLVSLEGIWRSERNTSCQCSFAALLIQLFCYKVYSQEPRLFKVFFYFNWKIKTITLIFGDLEKRLLSEMNYYVLKCVPYACVCPQRMSDSLQLGFLLWVLESKLGSSKRTISTHCWAWLQIWCSCFK